MGGGSPSLVKDVTTILGPLTEKVEYFPLHLEIVVVQAWKILPDQVIIPGYGLFIESTTVQELTVTPRSLGGGVPTGRSCIQTLTEGSRCLMQWVTILW